MLRCGRFSSIKVCEAHGNLPLRPERAGQQAFDGGADAEAASDDGVDGGCRRDGIAGRRQRACSWKAGDGLCTMPDVPAGGLGAGNFVSNKAPGSTIVEAEWLAGNSCFVPMIASSLLLTVRWQRPAAALMLKSPVLQSNTWH